MRSQFFLAIILLNALATADETPYFVDLTSVVNMGFSDEVAEDGKGGWTDQGKNDFRHMPVGEQKLCGVLFRIIDPQKNHGRSCLVLRGEPRPNFPAAAKVAIGKKAACLVFLHTMAWGDDKAVATYRVNYSDGKTEEIPIRPTHEIVGWWGAGESETVKAAVVSHNSSIRQIAIHAWAWPNPRPEVTVESLEFISANGKGVAIIVAVTLLPQPVTLKSELPPANAQGYAWLEAENLSSFNLKPYVPVIKNGVEDKTQPKGYKKWRDPKFSGGMLMYLGPFERPSSIRDQDEIEEWEREGVLRASYEFAADQTAEYTFWARVGPANVFTPFCWRVDNGERHDISPGKEPAFQDMWEISFWVTMGWIRLGTQRLEKGKHTLWIEIPRPTRMDSPSKAVDNVEEAVARDELEGVGDHDPIDDLTKDRVDSPKSSMGSGESDKKTANPSGGWHLMADCFVATRVPFYPCGTLKPGEEFTDLGWFDQYARIAVADLSAENLSDNGQRDIFWLDGLWEKARDQEPIPSPVDADQTLRRSPLRDMPDVKALHWMAAFVPPKPELENRRKADGLLHRFWYRKIVTMPDSLKGKRVSLHFSYANYLSSIFVNGKLCGTHDCGYVPFAVDITDAIKPGEYNEILVGIKGLRYFYDDPDKFRCDIPADFGIAFMRKMLAPGRTAWESDLCADGLPGSCWLEFHGAIHGHDLFVQSKVSEKKIMPQVEVTNATGQRFRGKVRFSVYEESEPPQPPTASQREVEREIPKKLRKIADAGEVEIDLEAGQTTVAKAEASAENLRLWWPGWYGDKAQLYVLAAAIVDADGNIRDRVEDYFGYREVTIEKQWLCVNGKRFNMRAVLPGKEETVEEKFMALREIGTNLLRVPSALVEELTRDRDPTRRMLRFLDQQGIPCRFNSMINGMVIDMNNFDPRWWQYATAYFRKWIKAYRNHPAILLWVAENELDLISNMGNDPGHKKRQWEMMALAHEIDPSRPIMADGAGDLLGKCEICNWHYPEGGVLFDPNNKAEAEARAKGSTLALYPENAFTFSYIARSSRIRPWDRQKPLFVGETYFYSGPIKWQCWMGGDEVLASRFAANEASARYVEMLASGYRWQDVSGFHFWTGVHALPGKQIRQTMAPVAALCRDYNTRFYAGQKFTRRLKICNDTFDSAPLRFSWRLVVGDKTLDEGSSEHRIAEGFSVEQTLAIKAPAQVSERTEGVLQYRIWRGDKEVFSADHKISFFPAQPPLPNNKGRAILLYDPKESLVAHLGQWGLKCERLAHLGDLAKFQDAVLIVGAGAADEKSFDVWDALKRFASQQGGRILILEQRQPVAKQFLPFPCKTIHNPMAQAYPRGNHPALTGIERFDLCVWAGTIAVFEWAFARDVRWPLIVDASCGDGMELAPVIETPYGKGHFILSQLLLAANLGKEPIADRLLANFIAYLADLPPRRRLAAWLKTDSAEYTAMKEAKISCRYFPPEDAGADTFELCNPFDAFDILVLPGEAPAMKALLRLQKEAQAFFQRGGWIVLAGLTPDAAKILSRQIGEEIILAPVGRKRITLIQREDPLAAGWGNHELYREHVMSDEAARKECFLFGDRELRDDVMNACIIYDDVALLTRPTNLNNYLTAEDHWKYIHYAGEEVTVDWRQPFEIAKVAVKFNRHYAIVAEVALRFGDAKTDAMVLPTGREEDEVIFEFAPRIASKITLRAAKFRKTGLVGWDTVKVYRTLSESFVKKVVPLTRPAGIVKFPHGAGGIILNLLNPRDSSGKSDRILMQILHNLGAGRQISGAGGHEKKEIGKGDDEDDIGIPVADD